MSVATLEQPCAVDDASVFAALSALRSNSDELGVLLDEVFDDLESLGTAAEVKSQLLDEARQQITQQTAELNAVRHAEALAAAELVAMRSQIDHAQGQLAALPRENDELKEHLHALELERRGLESELEALRVRAAELTDHLSEVKREAADERAEWSSELKQLRRTLERQSELLANRISAATIDRAETTTNSAPHNAVVATPGTAHRPEPDVPARPAAVSPKDTVLGSVIAQFEMLQKDRQRRRL